MPSHDDHHIRSKKWLATFYAGLHIIFRNFRLESLFYECFKKKITSGLVIQCLFFIA